MWSERVSVLAMEVQKVIKAKVVELTNVKRLILDHEYEGLQRFL